MSAPIGIRAIHGVMVLDMRPRLTYTYLATIGSRAGDRAEPARRIMPALQVHCLINPSRSIPVCGIRCVENRQCSSAHTTTQEHHVEPAVLGVPIRRDRMPAWRPTQVSKCERVRRTVP